MKKIFIILSLMGLVALAGCENFLDTKQLTQRNTKNFPENEEEMDGLLTGLYHAAHHMEMPTNANCLFVLSEIMSDDRFAGGGEDDDDWAKIESFKCDNYNFLAGAWRQAYATIFRANNIFGMMGADNIAWSNPANRNYVAGQTHFLRAYAYFTLARLFGTAPMPVSATPVNLPRSSADDLFAMIGSDLRAAIDLMPSEPRQRDRVRASKWAAEALMARAWLFYTGYYKKESMPTQGGGAISKSDVIGWLDDCIANSGHNLIGDFRNLWPYSNSFTTPDYPYAQTNNLNWVGETGANTETVFAFSTAPSAGSADASNRIVLYFSMRGDDYDERFPFGRGWGFGTVNPELWDGWPADDIRRQGSIINFAEEVPQYKWNHETCMHETGYMQKKYMAIEAWDDGHKNQSYSYMMYGNWISTSYMGNHTQDLVTIRFADVLLMHSELTGTAEGMTRVRARVGLGAVPYSIEALRNERRWELAFEGVRYYDLLRWGIAAEALNRQNGTRVKNVGRDEEIKIGDHTELLARTGGFMPIPAEEIAKSNGVLTQSRGWTE